MPATDPSSHAIATVVLGGARSDGTPVAFVQAAVCDVCGGWATDVCAAGVTTGNGDPVNGRVSRRTHVVVYTCPEHYNEVLDGLCDEYGSSCNRYDVDDLAVAVDRRARLRHTDLTGKIAPTR